MLPLFTSLPPSMRRPDKQGVDIGQDYQRTCIQSWQAAGFLPVSINSDNEPCPSAVKTALVKRDALKETGRNLVYLDDCLSAIEQEAAGGPYALTNADICFPEASTLYDTISAIKPGEFMLWRRIDIEDLSAPSGNAYHYGFDLFAGHSSDLPQINATGFVLGIPWWDHFLPLAMAASGIQLRQPAPAVLHLSHQDRWNTTSWRIFGQRFIERIRHCFYTGEYRTKLEVAIDGDKGHPLHDFAYVCCNAVPQFVAAQEQERALCKIAEVNIDFLDEVSRETQPLPISFLPQASGNSHLGAS